MNNRIKKFSEEIEGKIVTIQCKEDELELAIIAITPLVKEGIEMGYSPKWEVEEDITP